MGAGRCWRRAGDRRCPAGRYGAGDGGWFVATTQAPAGTRYRFRIGDTVVPDPASRAQSGGVHGWSLVIDPAYPWTVTDWRGRPWEETVLVELHPGLLGGFRGVIDQLPAIAATGITAIELMPVGAFGGTRGWGYDGVLPYAPHESYGAPADLQALVDAAHGFGLSVFLDVVYNHFGPDGNYIGQYATGFFDAEVHTPWGGAVAMHEEAVHRFFVDNALVWLRDYRIDGLRFDAVHAIADDAFLDAMATEIREALPDRHIHLVLENERNDAARLRDGGYDAQWNDDFHNVLHVLLTGETNAYYTDFADHPAERLARCLAEGFIYQGEGSANHDGMSRGTPSAHLSPTRFVSFLQNHDQIGNRALGERLTVLTDPAKLRAATALLLLVPQIPCCSWATPTAARRPSCSSPISTTNSPMRCVRGGARNSPSSTLRRSAGARTHSRSQRPQHLRRIAARARPGRRHMARAVPRPDRAAHDPYRPPPCRRDGDRCGGDRRRRGHRPLAPG